MEEILQKAFFQAIDKENSFSVLFDLKGEAEFSLLADISGLQDSFRIRTLRRSIRLAEALINEAGELDRSVCKKLNIFFQEKGHILCPNGENDWIVTERQRSLLANLPELFKSIRRFQKPLCHSAAENLIRENLQLSQKVLLTNAHIRRSVLAACLTFLRQNVGSCFATAPAIVIQEEQIEKFIDDLYELLFTGKLKRVIAGVEFSVPLSPSWGWGDLRKKIDAGKIEYCPGFLFALTKAGILEAETSLEKKVAKAAEFVYPFRGKGFTIEELLRAILVGHFGGRIEEKEKEARSCFRSISDHPLLKAWEFTVASFSEAKMDFSRWNLFLSLGLHHEEKGGIGEVLYNFSNEKLQECNKKIESFQIEYENAFNQVKVVEALLRGSASEEESRRLRAEYQARFYHMQASLDLRDKAYAAAENYSSIYSFIVKQYDEKFPEYFQEIYDPEMTEMTSSEEIYDDAPAGFRLVYKHGRTDPSSWNFIYDGKEFVDALIDFFRMTEGLITAVYDWEEGKSAIQEITTQVILHVRSQEFLESAIRRRNKPWAYISGGRLADLLKIYCRREGEFTEEERWVENEQELLIFYLDALKNLPSSVLESGKKMLAYSPTHAFILEPFWDLFSKGWNHEGFTYTWVRDEVIEPRRSFYQKIFLSEEEQQFLIEQFANSLPHLLAHKWQQEIPFLDNLTLLQNFYNKLKIKEISALWEGFLYEAIPLTPSSKWKELVQQICSHSRKKKGIESLDEPKTPFLTKRMLLDRAKACYLEAEKSPFFTNDIHRMVLSKAIEMGLAPPVPLIFADTNWPNFFFAFLVNPGTLSLELWRTDSTGTYGMPMTNWKQFMNGSVKKTWGVFTRPHQYR